MNPQVFINGQCYSWSDLQWLIFGIPLTGITEINYSRKRDAPNNYGAGNEPIGFGYKNFMYAGDISVYIDELRNIANSPSTPNRSILEIPPFSATNIFGNPSSGVPFATDKLKNIRFTEDIFAAKQNDSAIIVKVPFVFAGLYH